MGAAAEFVKDHPFLTFFIATAAIEGVVTIVRGCRCAELPERLPEPGCSAVKIRTRFPWVTVSQGPRAVPIPNVPGESFPVWSATHEDAYGWR